jgi:lysophospholipase L1-like esterase
MQHEGASGWTVDQLVADPSLPGAIASRQPHVVLLHMGTNDLLTQGNAPTVAAADMRALIDIVQAAAPTATIVLARIIPSVPGNATIRNEYNALLATVAAQETTATSRIYVVDQATGFNPTAGVHTHDGIHPNAAGEALMAQRWYSVLGRLVPN